MVKFILSQPLHKLQGHNQRSVCKCRVGAMSALIATCFPPLKQAPRESRAHHSLLRVPKYTHAKCPEDLQLSESLEQ